MGKIIGGSSHGRNDALVDTTGAVLLDDVHVVQVTVTNTAAVQAAVGLELSGRINRTTERSSTLYLFDTDGAAVIVAELLALAGRGQFLPELLARIEALGEAGDLAP